MGSCVLFIQVKIHLDKILISKYPKYIKRMYLITQISSLDQNNIYNIQIPLRDKNKIIQKYGLLEKGKIKEYWINNVNIISNQNNLIFQYINDISANYDKKNEILIQEYTLIPCIAFSFYTPDIEEEYYLYESIVDDSRIRLKEFNNYLTLELSCNNLSDITKIK